jgi:hypothetical protein
MDGKKGLRRLFLWPRPRPEPKAVDPADVGTAFGMELVIEEANGNSEAASSPGSARVGTDSHESHRLKQR